MSYRVDRRCGSDLMLLWLWCWPAAVPPIGPLVWEPPYATGAALKIKKKRSGRPSPSCKEACHRADKSDRGDRNKDTGSVPCPEMTSEHKATGDENGSGVGVAGRGCLGPGWLGGNHTLAPRCGGGDGWALGAILSPPGRCSRQSPPGWRSLPSWGQGSLVLEVSSPRWERD